MIKLGLDRFQTDENLAKEITGNVAYLCHAASVDGQLRFGADIMKEKLGTRLKALFGPQHGLVSNVQDNMVETNHYTDPYYGVPVYSLYSETRKPNLEMLKEIDTVVVDLQDVGTRVYTYITTLSLLMESCESEGIKVVVLDRPNPVGGETIEGNILEDEWRSFVGHHPIPMRHSLTIGEIAKLQQKLYTPNVDLKVIEMDGWRRSMHWRETELTWLNPSPNLSTPESALVFCGSVLFEGTNISEGRGTTRALEQLGAPGIQVQEAVHQLNHSLKSDWGIDGVHLRAVNFHPMFQKHQGQNCQGFFIHPQGDFLSWRLGQVLLQHFYHQSDFSFEWNDKPYEYEFENLAIDYINGSKKLREWIENKGSLEDLVELEKRNQDTFLNLREDVLIYK